MLLSVHALGSYVVRLGPSEMEHRTESLVSVIIPTYNRAQYVSDALQSALNQEGVATEIIVVDDGSTDDTRLRIQEHFGRITYIYQKNMGAGAARNTGMRASHGEFVAFLDSDDIWEPFKLRLQLSYLSSHPNVDLVCTDFSGFTDQGAFFSSFIEHYCQIVRSIGRKFDRIFQHRELFSFEGRDVPAYFGNVFDTLLAGYFTLTSTVMMRRHCITACGYFREDIPSNEDYDYWLRLARRHTFAYLDIPTVRYRYAHADQLSGPGYSAAMLRVWLDMVERVRRHDPEYYDTHRAHVERVLRQCRAGLAWTLYRQGDYRAAMTAFAQAVRAYPWQKRAYAYLVLSSLRAGLNALGALGRSRAALRPYRRAVEE
jgi:glycosyltransferase involved in cell wall biosynthesis